MSEVGSNLALIQWVRISVLLLCFAGAAWLDHKTRRVSNEWWFGWAKPAIFLLSMELIILNANWMIWMTASSAVAFASTALIGRPDIRDIRAGSVLDIIVSVWYFVSGVGLVMGAIAYGPMLIDYYDISNPIPEQIETALLWARMAVIILVLLVFEMAWRFRLLHGGADAKAMMLAALLIPSWSHANFPLIAAESDQIALPPAIGLFVWAGLAFLALPLINLVRNFISGDILPLSMSWHASKMPLNQIPKKHVWLLEEVIDKPDGTRGIVRKMRPVRGSRAETELETVLDELECEGIMRAWVTAKHPFLVFVFPAIIPLIVLGDPIIFAFSLF